VAGTFSGHAIPDRLEINVPLPVDGTGRVGRRCPACSRYFKVKPGTGLATPKCQCPYCEHTGDASDFTTPEQAAYVRSVGLREAQERILKPMMRGFGESLKGIGRSTSGGPIQIRVEVRDEWRFIPLAVYQEREVETDVTCEACGLEFAVYGVFATCPDCAEMNTSTVFRRSLEAAGRRLNLLDGDIEEEVARSLLSDALGSAVGAFDAVGKELRRRFPSLLPAKPRNLFQNIDALSSALEQATGTSLADALGPDAWESLRLMFQVRHLQEHTLGVVDDSSVTQVPELAPLLGRKYPLTRTEVEEFLGLLERAFDAVVSSLTETTPL